MSISYDLKVNFPDNLSDSEKRWVEQVFERELGDAVVKLRESFGYDTTDIAISGKDVPNWAEEPKFKVGDKVVFSDWRATYSGEGYDVRDRGPMTVTEMRYQRSGWLVMLRYADGVDYGGTHQSFLAAAPEES